MAKNGGDYHCVAHRPSKYSATKTGEQKGGVKAITALEGKWFAGIKLDVISVSGLGISAISWLSVIGSLIS